MFSLSHHNTPLLQLFLVLYEFIVSLLSSVLRSIHETPVAERASISAIASASASDADVSNTSLVVKETPETERSPETNIAER